MKVSTRTIDTWMKKRLIPYRKIGRTVRFIWSEVTEILARNQKDAKPPDPDFWPGPGVAARLRERAKEIRRNNRQGRSGALLS